MHVPFYEFMIMNPYKKKLDGAIAGAGVGSYGHRKLNPRSWKTIDGVRLSSMTFTSALINGRGQYKGNQAPLPWFRVTPNAWTGFYIINPGVEYTFSLQVDQHELEVTSLGVGEVHPRTVKTVYLNPGERVRVRLHAKNPIGNYWIRATTLDGQAESLGVLHYNGADIQEPNDSIEVCTQEKPCSIYNCPSYDVPNTAIDCLASFQFRGTGRAEELRRKTQNVDLEVFLDFAFPIGASINGYRFVNPKNHLYSEFPNDKKCTRKECKNKGCYCTHYLGIYMYNIRKKCKSYYILVNIKSLQTLTITLNFRLAVQCNHSNGFVRLRRHNG